jgi:hypothetical protein
MFIPNLSLYWVRGHLRSSHDQELVKVFFSETDVLLVVDEEGSVEAIEVWMWTNWGERVVGAVCTYELMN